MRFWKRKASIVQISKKQLELETAKEILQEVFHARPSDLEDMIHSRNVQVVTSYSLRLLRKEIMESSGDAGIDLRALKIKSIWVKKAAFYLCVGVVYRNPHNHFNI
jgi:hypothetical protein